MIFKISSSLFRPNNLKDKNLKKSMLISILFFIAFIIIEKFFITPDKFSVIFPIKKFVCTFLTFFLFKEVDPDSSYKSEYATFFTGLILLFYESCNMITILFMMLITRFFTRSAGVKPTIVDYIILLFFSLFGFVFYSYLFTLYLGICLLMDFLLKKSSIFSIIFSLPLIILSSMTFFKIYNITYMNFEIFELILCVFLSVMFMIRLSFMKMVLSTTDNERYFISPRRLKTVNFITSLFIIFYLISFGDIGSISGMLSVMFFSSVPFINDLLLQNKNKSK